MLQVHLDSPIGTIEATLDGGALTALGFTDGPAGPRTDTGAAPALEDALARYFDGALDALARIRVRAEGTPFQQRVWRSLAAIPPGAVRGYGELAAELGLRGGARAVGHAAARNPVALVIPCHRLVAADGALTGYAFGVERKRWLLAHELRGSARLEASARQGALALPELVGSGARL